MTTQSAIRLDPKYEHHPSAAKLPRHVRSVIGLHAETALVIGLGTLGLIVVASLALQAGAGADTVTIITLVVLGAVAVLMAWAGWSSLLFGGHARAVAVVRGQHAALADESAQIIVGKVEGVQVFSGRGVTIATMQYSFRSPTTRQPIRAEHHWRVLTRPYPAAGDTLDILYLDDAAFVPL